MSAHTNRALDLGASEVKEDPGVRLSVTPEMFPGVYANYAEAQQTEREVTLDFYRIGPGGQQGLCVSRVNFSPLMLQELERAIAEQRAAYSERSGSASTPASTD
jgi:hypothetical protein